ncbi:glycoside hydrolase family 43 protein [Spirochaeta thermophila]
MWRDTLSPSLHSARKRENISSATRSKPMKNTQHHLPAILGTLLILFLSYSTGCRILPEGEVDPTPWDNPIIRDIYSADPAALVHGDTLYLYVGHDEAPEGATTYVMNDWYCYSTKDMIHWTNHGPVLSVRDFAWADGNAWAGQVVHRNGKFYYYVSVAQASTGGMAIGVAVSDSPTGPFTDALGRALITSSMTKFSGQPRWSWDDIDPTVLIDDDGQAYLYFGNTYPKYVKLNEDMISFDEETGIQPLLLPFVAGLPFTEALWIHKYKGKYYLSWAAGWEEQLVYATSDHPTGPWKPGGKLMTHAENCNTSHHAIVEFKGKWYIFYHNGTLPGGGSYRRSVCAEYLTYDEEGNIPLISPSP